MMRRGTADVPLAEQLALAHGGLSFVWPHTEADFRAWHARSRMPAIRIGGLGVIGAWLAGLVFARLTAPSIFHGMATWVVFETLPLPVLCVSLTFSKRLHRWASTVHPFSTINSGLTCVALGFWVAHAPQLSMGLMMLVASLLPFYRYRTLPTAWALGPTLLLYEWLTFTDPSARDLGGMRLWYAFLPTIAVFISLVTSSFMDRVSRSSYCQDRIVAAQQAIIERERARAESERMRADDLLFSILPTPIAERLKRGPEVIADRFDDVTVLFADLVGFTPLAARLGPEKIVLLLNDIFTIFDELAGRHGVEKIKTVGDAYMAVSGVPSPRRDHAHAAAGLALDIRAAAEELSLRHGYDIRMRIGLCSGPVVAGVIGARKFAYDLWGDTVNTAARMEAHGITGEIQVAESTYVQLRDHYRFEERGVIMVKGKGPMPTWVLRGEG